MIFDDAKLINLLTLYDIEFATNFIIDIYLQDRKNGKYEKL